jgi:signal transduction histidine kinase/DNA-binding response OmpR family regulator
MGLGVEAENGQPGIIRVREISWDPGRLTRWKQSYPVGWSGEAYPLSASKGQIKEFSLRLAESDPREEIQQTIGRGKSYEGVVTGIVGYGAFIEIASGITGLLHRSQLPAWAKAPPIQLFWPGDRVFVTVQEVRYRDRKLVLGFHESAGQTGQQDLPGNVHPLNQWKDFDHEVDLFLKENTRKKHYLVVEDDPEQSMNISSWLRHLGQRVDVAVRAEDALAFLEKITPDVAFIDVGLPNMDGVELSGIILEKWPRIRVVVTTDLARAESVMDGLEELQQRDAELLIKPLLPEDLIGIIRKTGSKRSRKRTEQQNPELSDMIPDQASRIRSSNLKRNLLDRLRRYLGFELVILFSIDKTHRHVSILECSGDEMMLNTTAVPQLIYSPVRDVAEDQGIVVINDIESYSRDRFRYLLELYPDLTACIGVPVSSRMPSDFALFALDKHPHQISPEQKIYVEAMALAVGTYVEQENFNERSVLIQRSALIGHLTRGMVHEINNLVGPLHSRLDNLQVKLKRIEKTQDQAALPGLDNAMITNELIEIQNNVRRIITTTRMFGRIAAKGKNEVLRVDEIIDETIHFMRGISERSHVKISFTPPEHLLIIKNQAAALEQVLLNVLLNAVQQIAELRPDLGGWVHVGIDPPYEMGGPTFFRSLIEDNGPGIHTGLWDRIFEAGYTTRADGSGIGLYISWKLMEGLEGRI